MRHALVVGGSVAVLLAGAATVNAATPQLKGRYAVTGSTTCLAAQGTNRFNSAWQVDSAPYYTHSNTVIAIRTFNDDGTGRVEGRAHSTSTPLPNGGLRTPTASSSMFSFAFTYSVDAAGNFTSRMVPGSHSGVILTGPRAGQTFTESAITVSGLVSGDKNVIEFASVEPEVETTMYSNGDVREQVCNRSRVAAYLGK